MSLVAYGSSDESSDEEVISEESISNVAESKQIPEVKQISKSSEVSQSSNNITNAQISKNTEAGISKSLEVENVVEQTAEDLQESNLSRTRICLPTPKSVQEKDLNENKNSATDACNNGGINFNLLPQPKSKEFIETLIEDEDDYVPQKISHERIEKADKKEKAPVKISIPSLSDFKDLDNEAKTKSKPSQKGTGLFAVLPPPRSEILKSKTMVPYSIAKKVEKTKPVSKPLSTEEFRKVKSTKRPQKSMISANYDSNSDDEDNNHKTDFFSLSSKDDVPIPIIPISEIDHNTLNHRYSESDDYSEIPINEGQQYEILIPDKTLVSNVINLPKEEIIQKNKTEVGPKLPVPEQDYNIDSTGNLVFDEKAIEYLCGKRGVKRKNKEFQDVDIIEINGEDIKPDEREWMVKALTEEPVTRPISQGAGPSGLSKKKHQITYLAHQAKAMEVELKNQWAQNKLTRQQTQSKYGF